MFTERCGLYENQQSWVNCDLFFFLYNLKKHSPNLLDIFSSLQPDGIKNETLGMNCGHCLPSCTTQVMPTVFNIRNTKCSNTRRSFSYSFMRLPRSCLIDALPIIWILPERKNQTQIYKSVVEFFTCLLLLFLNCSRDLANLSQYLSMRVYYRDVTCVKYSRDIISTWDSLLCEYKRWRLTRHWMECKICWFTFQQHWAASSDFALVDRL